jgi:hypothetical protein
MTPRPKPGARRVRYFIIAGFEAWGLGLARGGITEDKDGRGRNSCVIIESGIIRHLTKI